MKGGLNGINKSFLLLLLIKLEHEIHDVYLI